MTTLQLGAALRACAGDVEAVALRQEFLREHPFVVSDGRRFKSLICAAHSVERDQIVTDIYTGRHYTFADCKRELDHFKPMWM